MTKQTRPGNIKNAPADRRYFRELGYSQIYPWAVDRVSPSGKTIVLREVLTDPDPEWKSRMQWFPGGFAGHCANQNEQTWLFAGIGERTKTIRQTKLGWAHKGTRFVECEAGPTYHYDYNF